MIISGALDRLHYESDQCVRYDSDRKLWIYQHSERRIDCKSWPLGAQDFTLEANSFKPEGWQGDDSKHKEESDVLKKRTFSESGL